MNMSDKFAILAYCHKINKKGSMTMNSAFPTEYTANENCKKIAINNGFLRFIFGDLIQLKSLKLN
jgi:hypothetical protein